MNKSKCKGCQWNNKPYWSIINPCENCYRDEVQTFTNWIDPTINQLQQENKQLKDNWNKLKKELKDKFEKYRYVEDECLRTMAQEDDSILFSMKCIESGDNNE